VNDALELESVFNQLLKNADDPQKRGEQASNYVKNKAGATGKVMDYIEANRLLTN
jgi:3-deoxy-D-manno-octulosonic-acid transferase